MRDILTAAENWASAAHYGKTHNGKASLTHLTEVVTKLYDLERDDEIIAAGWLHDTVKYTNTTSLEIGKTLGRRVGQLVQLVTDPDAPDRATAKEKLYENLLAEKNLFLRADAAFLKCADRFCNQRYAINTCDLVKLKNYCDEFWDFMESFGVSLKLEGYKPHRWVILEELLVQYEVMTKMLFEDVFGVI